MADAHTVLIIGGGTAGITVAARLLNADPELDVAILDPAEHHYYQPLWTLVGGGEFPREATERTMKSVMPPGVTWIRDRATGFRPEDHAVETADNGTIRYEQLVVCPGIQLNWGDIEGLGVHLELPGGASDLHGPEHRDQVRRRPAEDHVDRRTSLSPAEGPW